MDWINASPQAINLFPPAQEGLNPINNESSSDISEDLSDHTPLQPGKVRFFSQNRQKASLFSAYSCMLLWIQNYPQPPELFQKYSIAMWSFFERECLYLLPFLQQSRLATAGRRAAPPAYYSFEKLICICFLPKLQQNKFRDFRDYSTFSLDTSKKITHQDQLPTSFSFFLVKGTGRAIQVFGAFIFPC